MATTGIDLDGALQRLGYDAFRPGQREAIETLLEQRRLLLVAPTGGGKSLTYQLPATLLEGTTVVISPLIALMEDQVRGLRERGIEATFLASTLSRGELDEREAALRAGKYDLVYIALWHRLVEMRSKSKTDGRYDQADEHGSWLLAASRSKTSVDAELWGRPTDAPWGVIFPGEAAQDCGTLLTLCAPPVRASTFVTNVWRSAMSSLPKENRRAG